MPNPTTLTIAHQWQTFRQACVPQAASAAQITATERAFYGGAMIALEMLLAIGVLDEEPACEMLAGLKAEADAYMGAIAAKNKLGRWH